MNTKEINKIKFGDSEIVKVMNGNVEVWSAISMSEIVISPNELNLVQSGRTYNFSYTFADEQIPKGIYDIKVKAFYCDRISLFGNIHTFPYGDSQHIFTNLNTETIINNKLEINLTSYGTVTPQSVTLTFTKVG